MKTVQERVKEDSVFAAMVHSFYDMFNRYCGTGAGITPSEVREASGYAWQLYMERHPSPSYIIREPFDNPHND